MIPPHDAQGPVAAPAPAIVPGPLMASPAADVAGAVTRTDTTFQFAFTGPTTAVNSLKVLELALLDATGAVIPVDYFPIPLGGGLTAGSPLLQSDLTTNAVDGTGTLDSDGSSVFNFFVGARTEPASSIDPVAVRVALDLQGSDQITWNLSSGTHGANLTGGPHTVLSSDPAPAVPVIYPFV